MSTNCFCVVGPDERVRGIDLLDFNGAIVHAMRDAANPRFMAELLGEFFNESGDIDEHAIVSGYTLQRGTVVLEDEYEELQRNTERVRINAEVFGDVDLGEHALAVKVIAWMNANTLTFADVKRSVEEQKLNADLREAVALGLLEFDSNDLPEDVDVAVGRLRNALSAITAHELPGNDHARRGVMEQAKLPDLDDGFPDNRAIDAAHREEEMDRPEGYEEPHVECGDCDSVFPDRGSNAHCEECLATLPTGRQHWVLSNGECYPESFADYRESTP